MFSIKDRIQLGFDWFMITLGSMFDYSHADNQLQEESKDRHASLEDINDPYIDYATGGIVQPIKEARGTLFGFPVAEIHGHDRWCQYCTSHDVGLPKNNYSFTTPEFTTRVSLK